MSNFSALISFLSIPTNLPVEQNTLKTEHKSLYFQVWQQLAGADPSSTLPGRSPELLVIYVSLQQEQPPIKQVEMLSQKYILQF